MICSQVTITGETEKILKDLVTNLTDNETLVNAAVWASGDQICAKPRYVEKSQDPNGNWRFTYEFNTGCDIVEFGATGLTAFITKNFKLIAALFLAVFGFVLIWKWEDHLTKQIEADITISNNTQDCVNEVLARTDLTTEQKTALVEKCLESAQKPEPLDWKTIAILGIAVIGVSIFAGSRRG